MHRISLSRTLRIQNEVTNNQHMDSDHRGQNQKLTIDITNLIRLSKITQCNKIKKCRDYSVKEYSFKLIKT